MGVVALTTREDAAGFAPSVGPSPALGHALRARAEEVSETLVAHWRGRALADGLAEIEADIRRATLAGTLAVADYFVTGEAVTRDRAEEWDRTGEAPVLGRISLSGLTKLYLLWRQACSRVVREEASVHGVPAEIVERCLEAVQLGSDASLVRMAERFELGRGVLEEQLAERRAHLEHQALHDPLTGLANRALLLDRIAHAVESASRRETRPAVLFIDLDYFKSVNDASGHSAGDQLLLQVARRLQGVVRPNDTIARLGGDEFVVLCEDLDDPVAGGAVVAERIADRFSDPFVIAGKEILAAASIGVAAVEQGESAERVLARADQAMYRAKQLGRGRFELYDRSLDRLETRRADMTTALRHAVSRGELHLAYQPVVQLPARLLLAREALLRWRHPVLGNVPPAELIPLAESTGVIDEIGLWVIEQACEDCAGWREAGQTEVGIAVNVSGVQLASGRLPSDVEHALKSNGLPPGLLTIEVAETQLMVDRAQARESLDRLRALGVRIAIDDFGTGHSSLSWLARLPVDVVKVDRSVVSTMDLVDRQSLVVGAMAQLAHTLGLAVVAEGVETEAQLGRLAKLGCDAIQGFLLGYPAELPSLA